MFLALKVMLRWKAKFYKELLSKTVQIFLFTLSIGAAVQEVALLVLPSLEENKTNRQVSQTWFSKRAIQTSVGDWKS